MILNYKKFLESKFGGSLPNFTFKGVNYGDDSFDVRNTFGDKPTEVSKQRDRDIEIYAYNGVAMDEYDLDKLLIEYDNWCKVNKVDKIPLDKIDNSTISYIIKTMGMVSEGMKYHMDNGLNLMESIYRYGSKSFFNLINEARDNDYNKFIFSEEDMNLLETTQIGERGVYEGKSIWLDIPFEEVVLNEAEYKGKKVELGKPKRGGSKKFYVYVKSDKGNVIKVEFGAKSGGGKLSVKLSDPDARKRYDQRHGCSAGKHEDKTKPGYWSCRLPRYAKLLGLSGGGQWW